MWGAVVMARAVYRGYFQGGKRSARVTRLHGSLNCIAPAFLGVLNHMHHGGYICVAPDLR